MEVGCPLPLVKAAAMPLDVTSRTLLRWVQRYEEGTPILVIDQQVGRGPDHRGLLAGQTREEAHEQAAEHEPRHPAIPLTQKS
jgi:hypothetical protein